jgi:predicted  nucleic acid-binding Zn-ribbon protein
MGSLREVQKLDDRIRALRREIGAFDERLAAVEEPALRLEAELAQLRERLAQMRADARRLERAADDKRARAEKMELRLTRVSNLREEAAVKTELDLIVRAIAADEQEALHLLDQVHRSEVAEEELAGRTGEARAAVGPEQSAMIDDREALRSRLEELGARRSDVLEGVASQERRVYEAFHQSGRTVVVASLLEDGACGHCFGVIPLQIQNEVRQGGGMIRCEACGVILTTEPEPQIEPSLTESLSSGGGADAPALGSAAGSEAEEESEEGGAE